MWKNGEKSDKSVCCGHRELESNRVTSEHASRQTSGIIAFKIYKRLTLVLVSVGLALGFSAMFTAQVQAQELVNVYSLRQSFLIQPMLEAFEKDTGIKVRVVYATTGLAQRLQNEGKNSPADMVLTTGVGSLQEIVDLGLAQRVSSTTLRRNIPAALRDPGNKWFALTTRARIFYISNNAGKAVNAVENYEDLSNKALQGKLCMRSGYHNYNIALFAWLIAENGEQWFFDWIKGVKENLARKPQGNDRAQAKAIRDGLCEIGIGNSYYYGKMLNNSKQPEQIEWAKAIRLVFPNQNLKGTHVGISGMVLTRYAPNKKNAIRLMEYLTEEKAQSLYAKQNFEFPANPKVAKSQEVPELAVDFKVSQRKLKEISRYRKTATFILDKIKFDR